MQLVLNIFTRISFVFSVGETRFACGHVLGLLVNISVFISIGRGAISHVALRPGVRGWVKCRGRCSGWTHPALQFWGGGETLSPSLGRLAISSSVRPNERDGWDKYSSLPPQVSYAGCMRNKTVSDAGLPRNKNEKTMFILNVASGGTPPPPETLFNQSFFTLGTKPNAQSCSFHMCRTCQ